MKRLTRLARRRTPYGAAALLPALAVLLLAHAQVRAQSSQTYWMDGYEIEVTLKPLQPAFLIGEPVGLGLSFENRSGVDLEMLLSGENEGAKGESDDFEVIVNGPDGRVLSRPDDEDARRFNIYTNMRLPGVPTQYMATVGANLHLSLASWVKIEQPGHYTVVCRRGVRVGPLGRRYRIFPGTTKPATEIRLHAEFEVLEGGPDALGKLIEDLGAKMLDCGIHPPEQSSAVVAASRLSAIEDPRVVKLFVQALGQCKTPSIRYAALRVFEQSVNDEAFEGLRLATRDADEDFRTVAAQMLAQSKHPKAKGLLVSLRRDSYYGVRLMVLNALEKWDTEEARKLIWELSNDEHPLIKEEALRFLQERAGHPPRR